MGAGEAVAPSAVVDMLARAVPKEQRAGAVSTAFSGLHVGSVIGLIVSPAIISAYGWRSLFLTFGVVGMAWCFAFQALMHDIGQQEPELIKVLGATWDDTASTTATSSSTSSAAISRGRGTTSTSSSSSPASSSLENASAKLHIPYRAMIRSRPVQVLAFTHFSHNWLNYCMLSWLPSYFVDTLSIDLMHASQAALMPPLASIAAAAVAGRSADWLIMSGRPLATVRKAAQCTAFLVPATILTTMSVSAALQSITASQEAAAAVAAADLSLAVANGTSLIDAASSSSPVISAVVESAATSPATVLGLSGDAFLTIAGVTVALGTSAFSFSGLYCTHQDLSPKYASAMLGVTNTAAGMSGVVGVALVGFLLDHTGRSWELSLFAPSVFFLVTGAAAYALLGSNDSIDFDAEDDSRFPWEDRLHNLWKACQGRLRTTLPFLSRDQ